MRLSTSAIDKSAILWSINNRSITIVDDDAFTRIKEDFIAIRGELRLRIFSKQLVERIFLGKDDAKAIEALQKHLPGFQVQVIILILLRTTVL
jgi:hypothetical protein